LLDKKWLQHKPGNPAGAFMPKDLVDPVSTWRAAPRLNGNSLNAVFRAAGSRYSLSPALLKAIGEALSGLRADMVSPAGKLGLMQLSPGVARLLRLQDPFDPVENIFGGARYLRLLLDRSGGDLRLALAAYFNSEEAGVAAEAPPSRETQAFIDSVYAFAAAFAGRKKQEQKGELFTDLAGLLKNSPKACKDTRF